jgi:hypothetical protein
MPEIPNRRLSPGDLVVLTRVPQELLRGLPMEDQRAISGIAGRPIVLSGYDTDGRAELSFTDSAGATHFIYVQPNLIRRAS